MLCRRRRALNENVEPLPRITLLHGFAQNRRCMGPIALDLEQDHRVELVDLPGHGQRADAPSTLDVAAETIAQAIGPEPTLLFGYSLGARAALHVALHAPARVRGLILLGGTPGLRTDAERVARRFDDERWARLLELRGLTAFLEAWTAQAIFADVPPSLRNPEARRDNRAEGLAAMLRLAGTGAQRSRWEELPRLSMPVLLLSGELDAKFSTIAAQMAAAIGRSAVHQLIPRAGHAAHLVAPEATSALIRSFSARLAPPGSGRPAP